MTQWKDFQKSVEREYDFNDIDIQVYYDYTTWLKTKNYSVNSIGKCISNLKVIWKQREGHSERSMSEPLEDVQIRSIIEATLPDAPFSEGTFTVPTVKPERTFLEKICLLHEEFSNVDGEIRVDRMSRHLYDIYQPRKAGIADRALAGKELFRSIVDHRKKFIGLKGFDYSTLCAEQISIVPPELVIKAWEEDYNQMCEFMAYGDKPSFAEIIAAVTELNAELRIKL